MICDGIIQYNGIAWNPDNTKMYIADSGKNALVVFDYDLACGPTGTGNSVLDFNENGLGMPDGLGVDSRGNLYICHWTGKISVWRPDLSLMRIMEAPVRQVTCCGFGGDAMSDLYVTTGHLGYTPQQMEGRAGAGGIFRIRLEEEGLACGFYTV